MLILKPYENECYDFYIGNMKIINYKLKAKRLSKT